MLAERLLHRGPLLGTLLLLLLHDSRWIASTQKISISYMLVSIYLHCRVALERLQQRVEHGQLPQPLRDVLQRVLQALGRAVRLQPRGGEVQGLRGECGLELSTNIHFRNPC